MDLVTNGVVIIDAIKFVQQKKQELNQMNSNKDISGKEEERKSTKEKEKEEVLDSDNAELENTKNQVF
jgi:hypothetical protein